MGRLFYMKIIRLASLKGTEVCVLFGMLSITRPNFAGYNKQQVIVNGDVIFEYCPTAEELADTFTKPLDEETFLKFRERMLVDVSHLL